MCEIQNGIFDNLWSNFYCILIEFMDDKYQNFGLLLINVKNNVKMSFLWKNISSSMCLILCVWLINVLYKKISLVVYFFRRFIHILALDSAQLVALQWNLSLSTSLYWVYATFKRKHNFWSTWNLWQSLHLIELIKTRKKIEI